METIRNLQFSKTSQEFSVPITAKTSGSCSKSSSKSSNRPPRCLRCQVESGLTPTVTWEQDGVLRTVLLTHNTGPAPLSAEDVYTLSQILEEKVPAKYYLSARACEGILRRAKNRGKELPPMLEEALLQMITLEKCTCNEARGRKATINMLQ